MRTCFADITLVPGAAGANKRLRVPRIESFQTEQSIDNDVDSFSIDVGDVRGQLLGMLDRDTEVRVNLYCDDSTGVVKQTFAGLVDVETFVSEKTHTIQGSDIPSGILIGTDAQPGYWRHKNPRDLIISRCKALGLTNIQVAPMKQIGRLWSDASEKEWAFQYRVARMGGCFMWSTDTGRLIIDKLNYSATSYSYSFGHPPSNEPSANWIAVQDVSLVSNKQQRIERVVVYGEDKKKKGVVPSALATNPSGASIDRWLRKPNAISTLSTARTQKDLHDEANLQVFESIVGAQEYTLTVGSDTFIQQNQMARVNLPEYGLVGNYYVVGVNRTLSANGGLTQQIRLREKGYALDTRVPTAPKLATQPNLASGLASASIAEALTEQGGGIRWSAYFVRATREFLTPKGWDFSSALGVLLSICSVESGFKNEREGGNGTEWFPMPTSIPNVPPVRDPFAGDPFNGLPASTLPQAQQEWRKLFANSKGNPYNTYSREAGVGPMQLCVSPDTKILTADLRWVDAEDVTVGTQIVAFDEEGRGRKYKPRKRHFRTAVVEDMFISVMKRVRVMTEDGAVTVTPNHQFLVHRRPRYYWKAAKDLVPGDQIASVPTWEELASYDAGYLAGQFDGEGCLTFGTFVNNGNSTPSASLIWSQRESSPDVEHIKHLLEKYEFKPRWHARPGRGWGGARGQYEPVVAVGVAGGWLEIARFLGSIRPRRHLRNPKLHLLWESRILGACGRSTVVEVERLSDGPMVAHKTSTKTLITNGLLSHNTTLSLKEEADGYGWSGSAPKGTPEYAGGRWNPESNILAAAHYLATVAKGVGADPTNFGTIWKAVAAYNAGIAGAAAGGGTTYANKVRALYTGTYGPAASSASSAVQQTTAGSAVYNFTDGKGNVIVSLPAAAPRTVAKAITYAMSLRGQSLYLWGGKGQTDASGTPRFDCSSFCSKCLVVGDPGLAATINAPSPTTGHGDTIYDLYSKGGAVKKTALLPGDLVFFDSQEGEPLGHVGMYLGDGQFIADPSTGQYVSISSLNDPYYRDRYNGARRYFVWRKGSH